MFDLDSIEKQKKCRREYYMRHKEEMLKKAKKYYQDNKEMVLERNKKWLKMKIDSMSGMELMAYRIKRSEQSRRSERKRRMIEAINREKCTGCKWYKTESDTICTNKESPKCGKYTNARYTCEKFEPLEIEKYGF